MSAAALIPVNTVWRSGKSICLPPMWPRFYSRTWCNKCVGFVVGYRFCSKGFSLGSPVFLPPQKPTLLYFIRGPSASLSVARMFRVTFKQQSRFRIKWCVNMQVCIDHNSVVCCSGVERGHRR